MNTAIELNRKRVAEKTESWKGWASKTVAEVQASWEAERRDQLRQAIASRKEADEWNKKAIVGHPDYVATLKLAAAFYGKAERLSRESGVEYGQFRDNEGGDL